MRNLTSAGWKPQKTQKKKSRKNKITIRTARGTRTGVQLDPGHHLRHDHKPKIQKKNANVTRLHPFPFRFLSPPPDPFTRSAPTLRSCHPARAAQTQVLLGSEQLIIPRSSPNLPSPQKGLNQQTEEEEKKANNKSDLESESGRPPIGSRASGPIFRQLLVVSASCQC